jgi:peptidoglycan hydrolase-like protein with peptidoglycan-binding domain
VGDVQASLNNNGGGNDDTGGTVNGKDDDGYTDPKFNGNGGLTYAQVKELQEYYGVEADGKWGEASRAAANGWSADKAWESYQAAKKMPDVQGKDFIEYDSAASNYQEMSSMCEQLYKSEGKEAVLDMLREARSTGALNLNDYSTLFNRYRNKD